jgi:hypothetical protein
LEIPGGESRASLFRRIAELLSESPGIRQQDEFVDLLVTPSARRKAALSGPLSHLLQTAETFQ